MGDAGRAECGIQGGYRRWTYWKWVCCIDISELRRDIHTALCDVCEVKGVPIEEASGYVMEQEATVQRVSTEKWQVIKPAIIRLQ